MTNQDHHHQQRSIVVKLCFLLLVAVGSIIPSVSGASFFIDGKVGCKSSSYGLEFFDVSLSCGNSTDLLCRVGDNFTLKGDVDVASRLPTVVKVYPKICHPNGYLCTDILSNDVVRDSCKTLKAKNQQTTCPGKGNYTMNAKMFMPNSTALKSYLNLQTSKKFMLKAQLKPLRTTYEWYMAQQAEAADEADEDEAEEEDEQGDDAGNADDADDTDEEEADTEPTESLFCHIPLHYTSNDTFDVNAYFAKQEAGRSWQAEDRSYSNGTSWGGWSVVDRSYTNTYLSWANLGIVALLSMSVSAVAIKRRKTRTGDDDDDNEKAEDDTKATNFVVMNESPPAMLVV